MGQDWLDIHPNNDYGRVVEKACAKLRKKLATTKQRRVTDAEEATSN